tara:strand:- start:427 stop:537 length:111 start_codon:yes stop_codon:yes gene_type:complete
VIGVFLILIGMIVKFEIKAINAEEQQNISEGKTKKQ